MSGNIFVCLQGMDYLGGGRQQVSISMHLNQFTINFYNAFFLFFFK